MRFIRLIILIPLLFSFTITAKPKLVVGIVVDQMRYEYLYRFSDNYGDDGFKRLMKNGSVFTYAQFNYVPTYTATGHASIYTGTTPFYHGITGNDIFNAKYKKKMGAVEDPNYKGLHYGGFSPLPLFSNTIGDQLKLSNYHKSKVVSISIKDRAAILPGGRFADAAYFYDHIRGLFTTSEYYMKTLPEWMSKFNDKKIPHQYTKLEWTLSLPIERYTASAPDENSWEPDQFLEGRVSMPHSLKNLKEEDKTTMLINTPYGNQILVDLAEEVLKNENLGKGDFTDMFCISFSATDYIGHRYGPNSVEVQDMYIKLDQQIARILNLLDKQVGEGNYTLFFTSDHGVNEMQNDKRRVDDAFLEYDSLKAKVAAFTKEKFGTSEVLKTYLNKQIFLDYDVINKNGLEASKVRKDIAEFIRQSYPVFTQLVTRDELNGQTPKRDNNNPVLNGFNNIRSGDIFMELPPVQYWGKNNVEAGHGTAYIYDSLIPMIFFGWGVPAQENNTPVFIVDIAPTITNLLDITAPSGSIGIPLLKKK